MLHDFTPHFCTKYILNIICTIYRDLTTTQLVDLNLDKVQLDYFSNVGEMI